MKILIDTNILISAAYSSGGTAYRAYVKAVTAPNHAIICEQNLVELRRVFNRKFPDKLPLLERFLSLALAVLEIVPTPQGDLPDEAAIRDADDRPILRAAIAANADIIITGDKDFLDSGIIEPKIMGAAQFVQYMDGL